MIRLLARRRRRRAIVLCPSSSQTDEPSPVQIGPMERKALQKEEHAAEPKCRKGTEVTNLCELQARNQKNSIIFCRDAKRRSSLLLINGNIAKDEK